MMPRLGKRFSEQWHQDLLSAESHQNPNLPASMSMDSTFGANWKSNDPWCRPVTQRIMSALVEELGVGEDRRHRDEATGDQLKPFEPSPHDYERLEERIKGELKFLGLLGEEEEVGLLFHLKPPFASSITY